MLLEIIISKFSYYLKIMFRNTFPEPQPDSASNPYLNLSLFLLKISWNLNFFGKIDWLMNSGRQRAGNSLGYLKKKYILLFKTLQKKWYQSCDNLQNRDPFLHLGFLNYPNFVTIFCRVLKNNNFSKNIPSHPPPFAVRNSLKN